VAVQAVCPQPGNRPSPALEQCPAGVFQPRRRRRAGVRGPCDRCDRHHRHVQQADGGRFRPAL